MSRLYTGSDAIGFQDDDMFPTATAVAEYNWLVFACGAMSALALFGCIGMAVYRNVRQQQLGLATAINHMSQGLTMFDKRPSGSSCAMTATSSSTGCRPTWSSQAAPCAS
jgi:hypothetical protein